MFWLTVSEIGRLCYFGSSARLNVMVVRVCGGEADHLKHPASREENQAGARAGKHPSKHFPNDLFPVSKKAPPSQF